jgi:hypothetical protein
MTAIASILDFIYAVRYHILLLFFSAIASQEWGSYRKLASFKGPFLARFSNFWIGNTILTRKQYLEFYDVSQKYGCSPIYSRNLSLQCLTKTGELARVGPNILMTSDPDVVQRSA